MNSSESHTRFARSIPASYDTYLVPMLFESYAVDLVNRLAARRPARVLEIAAGTGVVTRQMAARLAPNASIVATDLSQAMLDRAAAIGTSRPIEWRQADVMQLPFGHESFDGAVCQFGVMFFPDKAKAFAEVRRVLRPGGVVLFNLWDRIEENELADTVRTALDFLYPDNPTRFLPSTPYGYHDRATIEQHLELGGFDAPADFVTVTARSRTESARLAAIGFCQGTPARHEIEARNPAGLDEATARTAALIAERFGPGPVDAKMQAHVVASKK